MATLCGMFASWLSNDRSNGFPPGTTRRDVSKAIPFAEMETVPVVAVALEPPKPRAGFCTMK